MHKIVPCFSAAGIFLQQIHPKRKKLLRVSLKSQKTTIVAVILSIYFSGCPSINPFASAGVIYSPNFPWTYPSSVSCNWNIQALSGKMINLNFTHFNLEYRFGNCDDDYVEVRYGYYQRTKFCGSNIPSSIYSYSSISVTFYSDYSRTYSGFLAFYQVGYSFPTTGSPVTWYTYPIYPTTPVTRYTYPIYPTTAYSTSSPYGACRPYSINSKLFL